jgi:hypothetical protein
MQELIGTPTNLATRKRKSRERPGIKEAAARIKENIADITAAREGMKKVIKNSTMLYTWIEDFEKDAHVNAFGFMDVKDGNGNLVYKSKSFKNNIMFEVGVPDPGKILDVYDLPPDHVLKGETTIRSARVPVHVTIKRSDSNPSATGYAGDCTFDAFPFTRAPVTEEHEVKQGRKTVVERVTRNIGEKVVSDTPVEVKGTCAFKKNIGYCFNPDRIGKMSDPQCTGIAGDIAIMARTMNDLLDIAAKSVKEGAEKRVA